MRGAWLGIVCFAVMALAACGTPQPTPLPTPAPGARETRIAEDTSVALARTATADAAGATQTAAARPTNTPVPTPTRPAIPTVAPTDPAAGTTPAVGVLRTGQRYQDPAGRFSLSVPADWTKSDALSGAGIVAFVSPTSAGGFRPNVNVGLNDVSSLSGMTLEQLAREAEAEEQQTFKNFQTISLEPLQIGGRPAYQLIYQVTMGSIALEQEQVFLLDGTTLHVLTFSAVPTNFAQYAPTFDAIAASYRIG